MSQARVTRVVITGVAGRMGSTLLRLAQESEGFAVAGTTDRTTPLDPSLSAADVVIDFTSAEASLAHAERCAARGVALVIGSTGFTSDAKAKLTSFATRIPIVLAPNTSVGVNLMIQVAAQLASVLGPDFDVEVLETHHRHKKDAPSGTALRLAEKLAEALHREPGDLTYSRHGQIGARPPKEIGVQTLRGGDVVGEHTVFFLGEGERMELTHRATNRDTFARGALRAALWVHGKAPGLYDMTDVLGLNEATR